MGSEGLFIFFEEKRDCENVQKGKSKGRVSSL